MQKKYDITYSNEVETKHPIWAKPYAGGKIKALFVPGIRFGREIIELVQRMDIEYETVTIDRDWDLNKWGIGEYMNLRGGLWDFGVMFDNLEKVLASDQEFDVMVLPAVNGWGYFSEKILEAVLKRVESGTGLILMKPFYGEGKQPVEVLDILSPLKNLFEEGFAPDKLAGEGFPKIETEKMGRGKWVPRKHFINNGIPFELLPYDELAYYPFEAKGDVILESGSGEPIAAVKQYGKGRIVAFGFYPRDILPQHCDFTGREPTYEPIIENLAGSGSRMTFNHLEYFYSLMYRSMIWASQKEPGCTIERVTVAGQRLKVELSDIGDYALAYRINDSFDEVVYLSETFEGTNELLLPDWISLGGEYRADVFLKQGEKVLDWATAVLNYPLPAGVMHISLSSGIATPGDVLKASVEVEGASGVLAVQVIDDFERIIFNQLQNITGSGSYPVLYQVDDCQSLHISFHVEVLVEGHAVQKVESQKVIVTPIDRSLKDFEVFMTPQNRGQGDFWALQREKFLEMGVTGLYPGSVKMLAMSGAHGLGVYWFHRFSYVDRKEQYLRTKDKKFLQRLPCLNDPEFWDGIENSIKDSVSKNRIFGPIAYYANDEGSMTCYTDEHDICFCPHCMSEMREWLKSQYGSLDELNKEWGTSFDTWESIEPYTAADALKTGEYASWADHRSFMEHTFVSAYRRIRACAASEDTGARIRMSGCQPSTAYSGYDYCQLHRHVGYFEAYSGGNQYEIHRSFALPGTIIGGWFGYGARGQAVQNQLWNGVFHGLTLASIFWEYSCINPDFTLFQGALDMAETFKELRNEGIGKLLLHTAVRDSLGIAVHYSMPAIHGSYILGHHGRYENNRQGWLDILEDIGCQYNFVAKQQIEAGELNTSGYKVLILPYAIAMGEKEALEIRAFVRNGGVVVGDFQTGIMDEHCKPLEQGLLDDIFGVIRLNTDCKQFYTCDSITDSSDFPYFAQKIAPFPPADHELYLAEPGIRTDSGKAAYLDSFMGRIAAVVVHAYGKGKGIYLNLSFDRYSSGRHKPGGGLFVKQLVRNLMDLCGIEKFAALRKADGTDIDNGFETVYYSDNSARYIGVLRDMGTQSRIGYDGLETGSGEAVTGSKDEVRLEFSKPSHVYDVRKKTYLGYADSAEIVIAPGGASLLSLLPYRVDGIHIHMEQSASRGQSLTVNIVLEASKQEGEYSNTVSINVYNPSGGYEWIYSSNEATKGLKVTRVFKLPYNEKTGSWKVVAKDVATGVAAEKTFEVV